MIIDEKFKEINLRRISDFKKSISFVDTFVSDYIISNIEDMEHVKKDNIAIINPISDHFKNKLTYIHRHCTIDNINSYAEIEKKYDIVVSLLNTHNVNNLNKYLEYSRSLLNSKGIFFGTFFSEGNLWQLQKSFFEAYERKGIDFINHFMPCLNVHTSAKLLQDSGFKNVVTSTDIAKEVYVNILEVLHDIKRMFGSNCLMDRNKYPLRRKILEEVDNIWIKNYNCVCDFSIIFFMGTKD